MSLPFVHIGDLEPNFRTSADCEKRGTYRESDDVHLAFDLLEHLFRSLDGPGPEGLPRPRLILFSGDLWSGYPGRKGDGPGGYQKHFRQLLTIWDEMTRTGIDIVWTIASHELKYFKKRVWPFTGLDGDRVFLPDAPKVQLVADLAGRVVFEEDDIRVIAFGGLGGSRLKDLTRSKVRRRIGQHEAGIKRLEAECARMRVIALSADEQPRGLERFCDYIGLGGLQSSGGKDRPRTPPRSSKPQVHLLGRPVTVNDNARAKVKRMDFVGGVAGSDGCEVKRVLAPIPEGIEASVPKWLSWPAIDWKP